MTVLISHSQVSHIPGKCLVKAGIYGMAGVIPQKGDRFTDVGLGMEYIPSPEITVHRGALLQVGIMRQQPLAEQAEELVK